MGIPLKPRYVNPAASSFVAASTKPALTFLGEDVGDTPLTYNIQIDTVNTFDSLGLVGTADSYSEANRNTDEPTYTGSSSAIAQSFTGNGGYLSTAKFYLSTAGTSSADLTAVLYAHSGVFGTSGVPTGAALATSGVIKGATLTSSPVLTTFTFTTNPLLTNATKYVISLESTGDDITNRVLLGEDSTSPTHDGNQSHFFGGTWTADSTRDICFYVLTITSPLLNKTSDVNPGFTGSPDNSDPFTAGQEVTYTVQTGEELSVSTTYYWRIRGKDANNPYSPWSTDVLVRPPGAWLKA